ncbi:glycosyltransferase family 4 protein [Candidatus Daviesbacteria bacterium]|nr:glycosyltransferase family 4 protein [Candidatus Daviesbacteria bacterium]
MNRGKKISIAILTEVLNTHSGSRAPIELSLALNKLNSKKIELYLVCFSYKLDKKLKKKLESQNIKIFILRVNNLSFLSKLKASLKLFEIFKKNSIDTILFHGSLPMFLIARVFKKPIITTYYGTQFNAFEEKFLPNEKISLFQKLINQLGNLAIYVFQAVPVLLSNKVVTMTKYGSDECYKLFRRKVGFIYQGADSDSLRSLKSKVVNKNSQITFISVSRITPYKGFHILIKAFNGLQPNKIKRRLIIVGSSVRKRYLDYLKALGDKNVYFFTDISDKKLITLYSKSNIYIGADRYLFFGLPPLEAAKFGIPSILMDYCSAREIVENNETGFVVNSDSELRNRMTELATNVKLRLSMGFAAKERTQKLFRWEETAKKYYSLIKNLNS